LAHRDSIVLSSFKNVGKKMMLRLNLDKRLIRNVDGLLVLCYHSIPVQGEWYYDILLSDFEQHLEYLTERFQIIPAIDYIDGKNGNRLQKIALTFDDGYEDNASNLYPLLLKYDIPATIFVATYYIHENTAKTIEPNPGFYKRMLTWKQLRELSESGLVTIGSHGIHHRKMTQLEQDELHDEFVNSRLMIESYIDAEVSLFAYPGGFFNEKTTQLLKETGYKGGFTSSPKINDNTTDRFEIGRIGISRRQSDVPSLSYLITKLIRDLKD
jgi:peptidoglycan/xylan/chitin deacetylase (PgdA/CDA1 family)